jgi:5-carboxymethyl-2-hydroxymuconate isomerase
MAYITVTYTYQHHLDPWGESDAAAREFALDLQAVVVAAGGARPGECQIRFTGADDAWFVAGGTSETHQAMRIEIALPAGLSPEAKHHLSESVLAFLRTKLRPTPDAEIHLSVEVRDLDAYTSHIEPAQDGPQDAIP